MKTYKVSVGEKEYIVKLEEVTDGAVAAKKPEPAPVAKAEPAPAVKETPAPVVAASGDAEVIEAPLQGSILKVDITPGKAVKEGEIVLIIEAMKLENEVVAPRDGVVEQVFVTKGDTVNAEDALYSLK